MSGCEAEALARGWCSKHYARWKARGTLDDPPPRIRSICTVGGCRLAIQGRGLCSKHYARNARHGSPTAGRRSSPKVNTCAREGCANDVIWFPSTQRKFCSRACALASPRKPYDYGIRVCAFCSASYKARGPMQKYCNDCIGPTVYSRGGASRSEGLVRLKKYGVTHRAWLEMVARHGGACWICRERPAAVLDHSHANGNARGALCHGCNTQLGALERKGWLPAAVAYLREHAFAG